MKFSGKLKRILPVVFVVFFALLVVGLVYYGSIPVRYTLAPGAISNTDISAPRSVKDTNETKARAQEKMNAVVPIYVRSDEISAAGVNNLTKLFSICNELRNNNINTDGTVKETYQAVSDKLIQSVQSNLGVTLTGKESFQLVTADQSLISYVQQQSVSIASLILSEKVDDAMMAQQIAEKTVGLTSSAGSLYVSNADLVKSLLLNFVKPNAVFDEAATNAARQTAYNSIMNNPVMIEKGTRIVSYGDVITQNTYQTLQDLDLIENNSFDFALLGGIVCYMVIIFAIMGIYLTRFEPDLVKDPRDITALSLSFLVPIICSVYFSGFSPLISPVYFTAVIVATYLGAQSGIVLSLLQVLIILPVCKFDVEFVFTSVIGIFVCSMIAGQRSRKYNSASLILLTSLSCFLAAVGINLVLKSSRTDILVSSLWAVLAGSVSVIAAIGFMPIFELISNTVSPVRLIDLSQPGNPLLKRLFVEAPGTSQHSMMVANLADSAAEAIGANPLLAKVGAYYHDIGKLEKPLYFTENQQDGKNPHDELSPEESAGIITAHPDQGVRLGRRYRLPSSIIRIIQEHHGSTFQAYFYHKAKMQAVEKGIAEPQVSIYKYRCSVPSSRESAVVMLADSCEAAIKSTGITSLDAAEELFRKLIKQKIDQDQLVNSGLSFNDVELIIRSFLQVYAGVFHERVKYPDDSSVRK